MSRTFIALALLLSLAVPGPAEAQQPAASGNIVTPAPPPREGTVGPEQLRDFTLPGTRPAQPAPATEVPRPATPPPSAAPAAPDAGAARRPDPALASGRPARTASDAPARAAPATAAEPSPTIEAAPLAPALPPSADEAPLPIPELGESEPTAPPSGPAEVTGGLPGWWPWLLAAVLTAIAAALVLRRRARPAYAGFAPEEPAADLPPAKPAAAPRARQPVKNPAPASAPAPELPQGLVTTRMRSAPPAGTVVTQVASSSAPSPAPASGGVVSRRLRGWIQIDLAVREIHLDEQQCVVRFDLRLSNDGTGPARDVAVEAIAINAGEGQSGELDGFFARPSPAAVAVAELLPLGSTTISHELRLPRSAIRAYEAQGRTLFVPIVAFNAAYRTAAGEGRTGAAFLVGHVLPGSEKLAPLRLASGADRLLGLGTRRLEERVRR